MAQSLESEVRDHLVRYLDVAAPLTLEEFYTWFVPVAWAVDEAAPETIALIEEIQVRLNEYTSDAITEEQLREALTPLITRSSVMGDPAVAR